MVTPQRSEDQPRKAAALEVDCATAGMDEPVTLTTADVGAGGLFIQTDAPLERGDRFGCRFDLGDNMPILAECEVAWVRRASAEGDLPPGMGVRFVSLAPDDRERLRRWLTGEEPHEAPRVSFQLAGVGQPVEAEFRTLSEDGMSAVADLPFLQVGAAVQVNVDEAGGGSRFGRIAWIEVEEPESNVPGESPRVRLGVSFEQDDAPPEPLSAPVPEPSEPVPLTVPKGGLGRSGASGSSEPVPLTVRKSVVGRSEASVSPELPYEDPSLPASGTHLAGGASVPPAPWDVDSISTPRRRPRQRRVRGRARADLRLGQAMGFLRELAAAHPRMTMGLAAAAGALLVVAMAAMAFGDSGRSAAKKKAAAASATPGTQAQPVEPVTPGSAGPAQAAAPAAAQVPAGAPPLPGTQPAAALAETGQGGHGSASPASGAATTGPAVLRTGPGAHRDPATVLARSNSLLSDPPRPRELPKRIPVFRAGRNVVVKLPVASKPTRIKHYLLANPDGVVVDAVGAKLAVRPGRYRLGDKRVRMVKALARGRSARFIVYYRKGVSSPKFRLEARPDSVRFVLASAAPVHRARRQGHRGRAHHARARRGQRSRLARQARRTRKLRPRRRRQARRRSPPRRSVPAPVAEATQD